MRFQNATTGYASNNGFWVGINNNENALIYNYHNSDLLFATNDIVRMAITSAGQIQQTNFSGIGFHMSGSGDPTLKISDTDGTNQHVMLAHNNGESYIVTRNNTSHGGFRVYSQNGSETLTRLRITAAGDVGIGDNSPDSSYGTNLSIYDSGSSGARIKLADSTSGKGSGDGFDLIDVGGTAYIINRDPGALVFSTSNTERMRIASNGAVTITGEDFPYCKSTVANKKLIIEEYTSYNANGGIEIRKKFPNGNVLPANYWLGDIHFKGWDGDQFIRGAKIEAVVEGTPANNVMPCGLRFSTNQGAASTTERVRISADGMMGVGMTPDPAGGSTYMMQLYNSGAQCYLCIGNGTSGGGPLNGVIFGNDTTNSYIYNREATPFIIGTSNAERMKIDANGHVRFGGSGDGFDSAWGHNSYGNTEVAIDGSGGYGVLHLRGDGAGSVNTRYSMGVGDEKFYMAYDDVNGVHRLVVKNDGTLITGLNITMREGNSGEAFRLQSNGANGYLRLVDVYDGLEVFRIHGDGALSYNTTGLSNYAQTAGGASTAGGSTGNWSFRRDTGAVVAATDADSGWAMMYMNKYDYNSGDDNRWISFYLNGQPKDTISWSGSNIVYGGGSDYRIKKNVRDFTSGIDKVKQLKVHIFDYIDTDRGNDHVGFIAHELQEIVPEAVSGEKDGMRKEEETGNDVMDVQMVDYGRVTPLLTAALQEALAKIETLEARIAALES